MKSLSFSLSSLPLSTDQVKYRFSYTPVLFEIFEKGEGYLNLTTIGGCFKFYLSKPFIRDIFFSSRNRGDCCTRNKNFFVAYMVYDTIKDQISLSRVYLYRSIPTKIKYRLGYSLVLFEIFKKKRGLFKSHHHWRMIYFKFYPIRDLFFSSSTCIEKLWRLLQQKLLSCLRFKMIKDLSFSLESLSIDID